MSLPSTGFNPFGVHQSQLNDLKTELENIGINSQKVEDVKRITKVIEQLTEIAKDVPETAVQSLVTEIVGPFAKIIFSIGERAPEEIRSSSYINLFRRLNQFIQTISDRIMEPFSSEVLQEWAPLFESFFKGRHSSLKESGSMLWKKTFGTVKSQLVWPENLRKTLEKIPKRYALFLPPESRLQSESDIFTDDEALDGLSSSSSDIYDKMITPPKVKTEILESQSSFQFSQQSKADEIAEKLLKGQQHTVQSLKSCSKADEKNSTPSRKRATKISLLDEDSNDFIAITTTPLSGRKNRLTDRQKEKFVEASGPRTSINYMNEESQSGFQKTEKLKNALTALNFDVEDSVSSLSPKEIKKESAEDICASTIHSNLDEANISQNVSQATRSTKRARRLFSDSPVKLVAAAPSKNNDFGSNQDSDKQIDSSPSLKRLKQDISTVNTLSSSTSPRSLYSESVEPLEKLPMMTEKSTSPKIKGCSEITATQCPATASGNRKSARLSLVHKKPSTENSLESSVVLSDIKERPEADPGTVDATEHKTPNTAEFHAVKDATVSQEFLKESELIHKSSPTKEKSTEIPKSPPKTPRTPSILRVSKANGTLSSPMTDRKKNRVHFGEESLPQESLPVTPRCKSTVNAFSPTRTISNSQLDAPSPRTPTSSFFPTLTECRDRIDKILPSLVPLCRKAYVESAKKSLSKVNVRTVGDFASLSKSEIDKLTWIKGRTTGARNILMQHERVWNADRHVVKDDLDSFEKTAFEGKQGKPAYETPEIVEAAVSNISSLIPVETECGSVIINEAVQKSPETIAVCSENANSVNTIPDVQSTVVLPQNTPPKRTTVTEESSSNTSSTASTATSTNTSFQRDALSGLCRINLAPIFFDRSKNVKKESSAETESQVKDDTIAHTSFLEDSRLLQKTCSSLSNAHTRNLWPTENSTSILNKLNKAAIFFKNLVQIRGYGDWDDVNFENDGVQATQTSLEEDMDTLVGVYKRFSRRHTSPTANALPWRSVMETINEAACLLEGIFLARSNSIQNTL